jgi:hypothetical protein
VVRFSVSRNNGLLQLDTGDAGQRSIQVPTDGSGRATVLLTLGDTAGQGNNRVLVSALGVTGEIEFCASALTAPPQTILMTMGDNQRGAVGQPLATPLEALVVDRDGNPVKAMTVRFTVTKGGGSIDGATQVDYVTGVDGIARAILALGPAPGISNNVVTATYEGLTTMAATFTASGLVPGNPAETRFKGVVLDNGLTPIPGAMVRIDHTDVSALTDAQGQFVLENVPVGKIHLLIDPSKSPRPETFPPLAFETVTVAGQANVLGQPIMIPALDTAGSRIVGGPDDVVLKMPGVPGLELTVFANSVTCRDGSKQCRVTISQVHLDKVPMPPPSGTIFMPPAWTVQPGGTKFDPPARISIPNDGMPPGRQIDIFQFDHDLNQFINIGKGTTTEDGLLIISDPGFGISSAGWGGCGQPQPPTTCASSCDDGNSCTADSCVDGSCVNTAQANGSACDDGQECTTNDKCQSGSCTGDPVTVNAIVGACVAAANSAASFTATSNAPDKVKWTAPSGSPASGTGGSFSVTYSAEGDYVVNAACAGSSKTKNVTVGPACAAIVPAANEVETVQAPGANFGLVSRLAHSAKYKGCVAGGKWCFRLEEFKEEHAIGFSNQGNTEITNANDADVTPATCQAIITDFTPSAGSAVQGTPTAPLATYVNLAIIEAHERFHVTDFRAKVTTPTMNDLATFVSAAANCTDCKSAPPAAFNAQMETIWNGHWPTYFNGMHEARAYVGENASMNALIAAIRARANAAPAAQGWPAACK